MLAPHRTHRDLGSQLSGQFSRPSPGGQYGKIGTVICLFRYDLNTFAPLRNLRDAITTKRHRATASRRRP